MSIPTCGSQGHIEVVQKGRKKSLLAEVKPQLFTYLLIHKPYLLPCHTGSSVIVSPASQVFVFMQCKDRQKEEILYVPLNIIV